MRIVREDKNTEATHYWSIYHLTVEPGITFRRADKSMFYGWLQSDLTIQYSHEIEEKDEPQGFWGWRSDGSKQDVWFGEWEPADDMSHFYKRE